MLFDDDKDKVPEFWSFQDETNYLFLQSRYKDRKAIGDEAGEKRKAVKNMDTDNPFYHRAAVSAEMAAMRYDMAYIVAENKKLRDYINTISWLHEQVGVLQGAYAHTKRLADLARIDYTLIETGLKMINKLKEELQNGTTQRSNEADGTES